MDKCRRQIPSSRQNAKENRCTAREDDILPYRHLNMSASPTQYFQLFTLHFSLLHILPPSGREGDREAVEGASGHRSRAKDIVKGGYGIRPYGDKTKQWAIYESPLRRTEKRREVQCHLRQMASHLPYRHLKYRLFRPKTFSSLRRQAKYHAEGISLSAYGRVHPPKGGKVISCKRLPPGKRWPPCLCRKVATAQIFLRFGLDKHITLCYNRWADRQCCYGSVGRARPW